MALTYKDSNDLMNDFDFRGRIKVAALKFANSLMDEAINTQWHGAHVRWASNVLLNSEQVATQLHPSVVMDPAVQQDGAAITDTALQGAVEGLVQKLIS